MRFSPRARRVAAIVSCLGVLLLFGTSAVPDAGADSTAPQISTSGHHPNDSLGLKHDDAHVFARVVRMMSRSRVPIHVCDVHDAARVTQRIAAKHRAPLVSMTHARRLTREGSCDACDADASA